MPVSDTAVGAILEIPTQALKGIKDAERAIWALHDASKKAADQIYEDFARRIPDGVQKFIDKLAEAKKAMDGLGTVNVTLNTGAAVSEGQKLSTQMQKTSADVSKAVQDMSASWSNLGKVNIKGFDISNYGTNLTEVLARLTQLKQDFKNEPIGSGRNQAMADEIRQLEEAVRLYKQAAEEKNKALNIIQHKQQNEKDKAYLDEQKRLLDRILQLRKDISQISISVQRGTITGKADMSADLAQLEKLRKELRETGWAYRDLRTFQSQTISEDARIKAEIQSQNAKNAGLRQEVDERNKLAAAITRANELTAQGQQGKTRLGSGEEAAIQRQLNSDYKNQLKILKEIGEIKAKAAEQGKTLTINSAEVQLIQALAQRYRVYAEDVNRVVGAYRAMGESAAKNFAADRSEQLARNAIMLADAQNKAAVAAQKEADAQAKAEEKAIAAGEKIIAQKEKQIQKEQEAANQAARKDYVSAIERELAVRDSVNRNLEQKIALQQKITALESKHAIAGVKDPTAKMSFTDETRLHSYYAQMQKLDDELKKLTLNYPQLAQASQQAFDTERINMLTVAMQKLADAQAKASVSKTSSDASAAEDKLNQLYTERLRLLKDKEQLENKALIATAQGQSVTLTQKENQLLAELTARLLSVDRQINAIGNTYAGLALKTKQAFKLPELQQSVQLQNQFNKALESIDTSNARQLTAEYKRLYAEYQKLNASLDQYNSKIAGQSYSVGTQVPSQSAQDIANRMADISTRMNEIERKNIQEIADFRLQREMEANQKSISDFVQAEAQKKAAALQAAQEESNARKQAFKSYLQSYQGAMAQADKIMSGRSGTSMFATNIENIKRAINDLKAASSSLNLLNPADVTKAEQLKKKIAELESLLKKYKDATTPDKPIISPQDAINAAKNATTLKQLEKAYKDLKEAMSGVDSSKPIWTQMNTQLGQTKAQIDAIKGKMGELRNQTQITGNMMGQLKGQIAAAFSIGAVTGFIKKMVETRAQFELQRVALGAILQDRDEANKIFSQIQQMALQSPFTIMGLEKATKQMAAFGFEAKNLKENVKMVADLGSGLGVDLERIVLVMGHLKARNYLEGTMVRQFTNMGFSVLGELAKYYTEIEGRMVSVADVQERVKKKMVEFADVEEVLKRVTSAGGMFYDMQKKQSESIWGQMQRITDAYDLMMNDIGKGNEGPIKAALTLIRDLIQHWRMLMPTIAAVGAAMTVVLAVQGVRLFIQSMQQLGTAVAGLAVKWHLVSAAAEGAALAQRAASSATAIGLIATAAVAVGGALLGAYFEAKKLNDELDKIRETGENNMAELVYGYVDLANKISSVTTSYEERKKAIDDLNRIYGEILPQEMLEIDNIKATTDGYKDATEALRAYSQEKIQQQQEEAVKQDFESKKTDYKDYLTDELGIKFWKNTGWSLSDIIDYNDLDTTEAELKGTIKRMAETVFQELQKGELKIEDAKERFIQLIGNYYNLESFTVPKGFMDNFDDIYDLFAEYQSKLEEINAQYSQFLTNEERIDFEKTAGQRKNYEDLTVAVDNFSKSLNAVMTEGGFDMLNQSMDSLTQKQQDALIGFQQSVQALNQWRGELGLPPLLLADIVDGIDSVMDAELKAKGITDEMLNSQLNALEALAKATNNNALLGWVKRVRDELDKTKLTPIQQEMQKMIKEVEKLNKVNLGGYKWAVIDAGTASSQLRRSVEQDLKMMKEDLQRYLISSGTVVSNTQKIVFAASEFLFGKSIGQIQAEIKAMEQLLNALGGPTSLPHEKKPNKTNKTNRTKKTDDKALEKAKEQLALIKEINKEYEKLNKTMNADAAIKKVDEQFKGRAKGMGLDWGRLFVNGWVDGIDFTNALKYFRDVMIKGYQSGSKDRKKFYEDVQDDIAESENNALIEGQKEGLDAAKRRIDEMFSNYDLSKTLRDANIDVNLAFMVGGEPMSLDEIQRRLDDILYTSLDESRRNDIGPEGALEYASDEMKKIYKDTQKKLTDIEYKELKQRLKNYQKYLAVMYSDRAKAMIDAHTMMANVTQDFNSYIAKLQEEAANPETTEDRYQQIQEQIKMLENQSKSAIEGIRNELNEKLNKFDWEAFKGSDVFTKMYQDMDNLSKKGIDVMIKRLEEMRKKLQSMDKVDYKAVKEITGHIEKLKDTRLNVGSIKDLFDMIKKGEQLRRGANGTSEEEEQKNLVMAQEQQEYYENQLATLDMIIALKRQEGQAADKTKNLTEDQLELYNQSEEDLTANRSVIAGQVEHFQRISKESSDNLDTLDKEGKALKKLNDIAEYLKEQFDKVYGSVVDVADALGADTEMWADFGKAIGDTIFSVITLTIQFKLMGKEAKSALGIVGWVATALQTVAQLLVAIFQHHDKKLQKQIDELHDSVEDLERAYEKLGKAMDKALTFDLYNANYDQAKRILEERIQKQKEIIALEEDKKKKDKDAIRDAKQEIEDLEEELTELRNRRIEAMGSRTDFLSAATDFVDTWLDAFRETGSGVDALRDHWKEFLDTLVVKQAAAALVSKRLEKVIGKINDAIDQGLTGTQLSSVIKSATDEWNSGAGELNEALKQFFEAMGIDLGNAELGLSDLQKGIQNITEPQAAAIEAYLNSMRYAVFRHTEQLDTLIATVQAQYAVGVDNPVVMELKGIRSVLDSIDMRLGSVIGRKGIESVVKVG